MYTEENKTPEILREEAKYYLRHCGDDADMHKKGIDSLLAAFKASDTEAVYLVARMLLEGKLHSTSPDPDYPLKLLCSAANNGCFEARVFLDGVCKVRYDRQFSGVKSDTDGPLTDFDGKTIRISRKGLFTPVDAVLEYKDGKNVLTLSANLFFIFEEDFPNSDDFARAVMRGIDSWQGDYTVFGGQQVSVKVNLTYENRLYDSVLVFAMSDVFVDGMRKGIGLTGNSERKERMEGMLRDKRSFAVHGIKKWTANSIKSVYIQSEDGKFDDYMEIMAVAKHEFGHVLGLGDLYQSRSDKLPGVAKGTYAELDTFAMGARDYNLVMCDHHGPISNNDIEMVILAFRENKMQLYQPERIKGDLSSALGKGN